MSERSKYLQKTDQWLSRATFQGGAGELAAVLTQFYIQHFDFSPGPRGFTEERQARLDAWLTPEAANVDTVGQAIPPVMRMKRNENGFKRHAVEWVFCLSHENPERLSA